MKASFSALLIPRMVSRIEFPSETHSCETEVVPLDKNDVLTTAKHYLVHIDFRRLTLGQLDEVLRSTEFSCIASRLDKVNMQTMTSVVAKSQCRNG